MQRQLGSIRLAPAERGEVPSHAEAPPGPHSNEQHTWHVPGPPLNPDHTVPPSQSILPTAPQHPGPVPTLGSGRDGPHRSKRSNAMCAGSI